jgi:hypothetical protein
VEAEIFARYEASDGAMDGRSSVRSTKASAKSLRNRCLWKNAVKISVIIPACESEKYINATLASVAGQTRLPDELIISDDSSSEQTKILVDEFAQAAPFLVRYFRHTPQGITSNYLNALSRATGDIVIIGDHDDVWVNNRIELIERYFARSRDTVLVSADSAFVNHELISLGGTVRGGKKRSIAISKKINEGDYFSMFLKGGLPLLAHTLAFRSSIVDHVLAKPSCIPGWWFEEWVSCVAACCGRIAFIPDALTLYRQHEGQTTRAQNSGPSNAQQQLTTGEHPGQSSVYSLRLMKMEYCLSLMTELSRASRAAGAEDAETLRKMEAIKKYIEFLNYRSRLYGLSSRPAVRQLLGAVFSGQYRQFSNGVFSMGLDALRLVRQRVRFLGPQRLS